MINFEVLATRISWTHVPTPAVPVLSSSLRRRSQSLMGSFFANCEASVTCQTSSTCQSPLVIDTDLHLLNDSSGLKEFSFEDRNLALASFSFGFYNRL